MNTASDLGTLRALPVEHRAKIMELAREMAVPEGVRLFEEGARADHFWLIRTGTIELDMRVPGRRAAVIERLGHNELVGWSWLFGPHVWHLGAQAVTPVRAYEFDAVAVRSLCHDDPAFAEAMSQWIGTIVARRLRATRTRLLDLYGPHGSGVAP
ncbi:cyclic nucleotide-binding domain-containing protein [Streptomyces sp. NPDC102406]|uniref:cyclic nucleotide-binding domain-containing protein n=1 Tax=Streptomyces sp. NPDC102406 TaxID=3366171 RepID=UPI0038222112